MRLIFLVVMLIGLGLAGFAIHTAQSRFGQYQQALTTTQSQIVATKYVYVVTRALRYGDTLGEDDVRAVSWPAASVPEGAFENAEAVFPKDATGPRTVLRAMEVGEPLLPMKVTQPGEAAGIAATLTAGMRAFTLTVDVNSGVSGFLRPGDRVDVYWTGGGDEGGMTRLIHSNLPLIAIDQETDEERSSPTIARTITVEATSAEVAKLAQAQATGRLTLALVGVRDETESEAVQATMSQILGPREAVAAERQCTIRTRKGSEVVEIPVPCPTSGG